MTGTELCPSALERRPLPSSHGGGFECVKRIIVDIPLQEMFASHHLKSRRGVYLCQDFCHEVQPGLKRKPEVARKKDEPPPPSFLSILCWKNDKDLSIADLEKRFVGKDDAVPWWGLTPLFEWHAHNVDDRPFGMDEKGIMLFMPFRTRTEDDAVAPVHVFGHAGAVAYEWWISLFKRGDGKTGCPKGTKFLSVENWQH